MKVALWKLSAEKKTETRCRSDQRRTTLTDERQILFGDDEERLALDFVERQRFELRESRQTIGLTRFESDRVLEIYVDGKREKNVS
jgi:hypothetical protein